MTGPANPVRGEASLRVGETDILLRPTFAALVAAEEEIGSLFALVERAAAGQLRLSEMVALFWHCRVEGAIPFDREQFSEAVTAGGMAASTPALKTLLAQILGGQ
ncbi:gene transfer agent family protein [Sphingorhabdus sp.]|uniref:gene transfer agent family protein n=1 Tax=Sphingorhabdus sp. TaxID=1902408 RepID=UPI0035B13282